MSVEDQYTKMDEDALKDILMRRYSYEEDEVKTLFPTEDDKREAIRGLDALAKAESTVDSSSLGWTGKDETLLTPSQEQQVDDRKTQRALHAAAKAKVKQAKAREQEDETMAVVEHDKTGLTREEIRDALAKLANTDFGEEEEEASKD